MRCSALALWIIARFTNFGPLVAARSSTSSRPSLLTVVLPPLDAIGASGIPRHVGSGFGVALPLFIYAFLSGGWVTRAAIGLLR